LAFAGTIAMMVSIFNKVESAGPTRNIVEKVDFIGQSFMTEYILAFEIIAFLLLLVLVGSAYYAKSSSDS
jgi:NADH:ubiquinone oxidoreductase subunit 6 (subunit J)